VVHCLIDARRSNQPSAAILACQFLPPALPARNIFQPRDKPVLSTSSCDLGLRGAEASFMACSKVTCYTAFISPSREQLPEQKRRRTGTEDQTDVQEPLPGPAAVSPGPWLLLVPWIRSPLPSSVSPVAKIKLCLAL